MTNGHAHRHACDFDDIARKGSYLPAALDGLSHYHLMHTHDEVTRFVTKSVDHGSSPERTVHVYITSTPEARKAFAEVGVRFGMKPIPEDCL